MEVKDRILELLEIQARVASLEGQVSLASGEVQKKQVAKELAEAKMRLDKAGKADAEKVVSNAEADVEDKKGKLAQADAALKQAQGALVKADENLSQYGDQLFLSNIEAISRAEGDKEAAASALNALAKELSDARARLGSKQKELRDQGYDFNFVERRSKTVVL